MPSDVDFLSPFRAARGKEGGQERRPVGSDVVAAGASIDVVVFDLGGVIMDLAGLKGFLRRHELDIGEFFSRALAGGAHAEFERGALDAGEYAAAFLAETGLDLDPEQFLAEFAGWPGGLFPGVAELLDEIPVTTASLSNTNPVHWHSEFCTAVVLPLFDRHFPSYQLGLAKPDPAIFRRVAGLLDVEPARVVFFDDNQVNVDSAASVGMHAHRVDGPDAARAVLAAAGVV